RDGGGTAPMRHRPEPAFLLHTHQAAGQSLSILLLDRTDLLMPRLRLLALLLFAIVELDATVVDRIAVIVGRRAIKTSDISEDMRVTGFLNREQISDTAAGKRKAAERLIDQELVRQDLANGQ